MYKEYLLKIGITVDKNAPNMLSLERDNYPPLYHEKMEHKKTGRLEE